MKDKPKREYSPLKDSRNYSTVIKTPHQVNYTKPIPGASYTSDDDRYFKSYDRPPILQNTNYFQPIQDPLEVLYRNSSQTYAQQQIPIAINNNNTSDSMQPFDLGNLINRIQQDYLNNVRPYVSSVQFVENEQSLTNLGFLTSTTTRKGFVFFFLEILKIICFLLKIIQNEVEDQHIIMILLIRMNFIQDIQNHIIIRIIIHP